MSQHIVRRPRQAAGRIRPVRRPTNDPQFTEAWEKLSTAIREIHRKNASLLSFEELYRNAYNMVLHKQGDQLYTGVKDVIYEHLSELVDSKIVPALPKSVEGPIIGATELAGGSEFLHLLKISWEDHTTCMGMIKDILMYVDRVYVKNNKLSTIYDLGLEIFRDAVVRSSTSGIREIIINTLLNLIRHERDGAVIERSLIKAVIDIMRELSSGDPADSSKTVYETDFEHKFLETTRQFYVVESTRFIHDNDATEYLKRAERRFAEEGERVKHYLNPVTEPKLIMLVEKELLETHVVNVLTMENSGLVSMIENRKFMDMQRLYRLFSRVPNGHSEMRNLISKHMKSVGQSINRAWLPSSTATSTTLKKSASSLSSLDEDATATKSSLSTTTNTAVVASPLKWVESMLELKTTFDTVLCESFFKDKRFETVMNDALESAVNENAKAPECVSLFLDENLRKGIKGKTEEEIEALLDNTITLFRFISEKDVFERYYNMHLAKRLLNGKSTSEDMERSIISKLKSECGNNFTSKLEGMFNDMRISRDLMPRFRAHLQTSNAETSFPDANVIVCTSTFWPMVSAETVCNYPGEILSLMSRFERFYHSQHTGRRLTWLSSASGSDLRANFEKGKKELSVTVYMTVVLLRVFNDVADEEPVSYSRIRELTAIPDLDLKRTLQSLSLGKHKILVKKNVEKVASEDKKSRMKLILDTDEFSIHSAFTAPSYKIKILNISSSAKVEEDEDAKETFSRVEEVRKHQIEAAIVRVMKARKSMDHNNLIAEVIKQLSGRFSPTPAIVKKRVETLIEREYLEREKGDRKMYHYVA